MHYNESPGAPRWPGGGGDCGVGPPPTLSLSVTHMAGSTAAPSMSVMWFHNVFVLFFFVLFYTFLTATLTLSAVVTSKSEK